MLKTMPPGPELLLLNPYFPREDFVTFAKSCGSVKDYLEKAAREQSRGSASAQSVRPPVIIGKQDQASTAFRAIDKDNSGFVDRDEFLQFTRCVSLDLMLV